MAALAIGMVAAVPEHGLTALLHRDDAGGMLVRRLSLPIIVIPLLIGWLRLQGQQAGYYDTAFGLSMVVLTTIFMLQALLAWTANGISRAAQVTRQSQSELEAVLRRDIADRKRAENELRQAEERMRSVVDHVVDGIITIDERGNIESFNPAAETLFGYQRSAVIGQNVKLLMPEPYHSQHDTYLHNYLTTNQAKIIGIGREVVGKRKDGSTFPMELAVSAFRVGSQRLFTGIVRDITERKQLEDQLRLRIEELAETDRRKNEFLATLAHELRNPLAPIRNALQILRMPTPADTDAGPVRDIMERQVNHMVRLVDDLLEVSRINNGKIELRPEAVDLAGVLQTAVETSQPLMDACGHRFHLTVPAVPLTVVTDPVRLSQVVANLLNNAAKYTEAGGKIWLSASRNDGHVAISVRDTGVGISRAVMPQLFRMFAQADRDRKRAQGGLGIGLALAQSLMELQGGWIEARSEGEGCGSEFIVHLPLGASDSASIIEDPAIVQPPSNVSVGGRMLVVDDNHDAATSLATILRMMGNDVQTANDGLTALQVLQSFKPSVMLLDLGMPGMDGYEVAERAQSMQAGQQCALVALTGWGQEEDRQRTRDAGFTCHLVKPVDLKTLRRLLTELHVGTYGDGDQSDSI